ncbi:hypothetical protein XF36_29115 (plasmid) [Pseudonocardia sp. HH130629-09]|nr:hypothetical protein XF36_29115 [Pseudonocardia sp. HH130629-09]
MTTEACTRCDSFRAGAFRGYHRLEYLEAEFYLRAVTGNGLKDSQIDGKGELGGVTGGYKVSFETKLGRQYAEEIAQDERAHVDFLRAALGDAKVARPEIDLQEAFTAAARAASVVGANETVLRRGFSTRRRPRCGRTSGGSTQRAESGRDPH